MYNDPMLDSNDNRRKEQRRKGERRINRLAALFDYAVASGVFLESRKSERRISHDRRNILAIEVSLN